MLRLYNYPAMNLPVKYRPKRFSEVTGQEHVTRTLYNALKSKRIASAYLFTGPRGVGKTTTARILAKGLNCEKGVTPEPCNVCTVCREIDASRSMDVVEIDGASNRGIDQVRDLRDHIRLMPTRGRYRVYIIDEVHMLTTEAFNALLKTLEEPPEHVVFIFATTEPRKVPETVISRTQRFDFRPLSSKDIERRLQEIADREQIAVSPEALQRIARYAHGSLRDAISLLEQLHVFAEGEIRAEDVVRLLGMVEDEQYVKLLERVLAQDVPGALRLVDSWFLQGISPQEFARGLEDALAQTLRAKAGLERNLFEGIAQKIAQEDLLSLMRAALNLEEAVRYSTFPRIWVDYHIARMCLLPRVAEISEILRKAGVTVFRTPPSRADHPTESAPPTGTSPKPSSVPPPSPSPPTSTPPPSRRTYEGFLSYLESLGATLLAERLKSANVHLNNSSFVVWVNSTEEQQAWEEHIPEIEDDLRTYFGKDFEVRVQVRARPDDPRFLKLKETFKLEEINHV